MKILLVSDIHKHSTKDVFQGYAQGMLDNGIDFEHYALHRYLDLYSKDTCICQVISKALIPDNKITHVLFVSGLEIPAYVYRTLDAHGIKVGVIATDDPHSSKPIHERLKYLKYWFTNEKAIADIYNATGKVQYMPTAASHYLPLFKDDIVPVDYLTDILFVGSAYHNRIPFLETAAKFCVKHNKRMLIAGHTTFIEDNPILRPFMKSGPIDNEETLKYLQGAYCTLNMSRDIYWHPYLPNNKSKLIDCVPFSANPRMYEASICGTLQITQDDRPEYRFYLENNALYFKDTGSLDVALNKAFFEISKEERERMVQINRNKTLARGCYCHRTMVLVEMIKDIDKTNDLQRGDTTDFEIIYQELDRMK